MSYYGSGYGYGTMTPYDRALLEDHEKLNQGIEPQNYDDYFDRDCEKVKEPENRKQIEEAPEKGSQDVAHPFQRENEPNTELARAADPSSGDDEADVEDVGPYQPQAVDHYGRPRGSQRQSISVQTYNLPGMVVTATRVRTTTTVMGNVPSRRSYNR